MPTRLVWSHELSAFSDISNKRRRVVVLTSLSLFIIFRVDYNSIIRNFIIDIHAQRACLILDTAYLTYPHYPPLYSDLWFPLLRSLLINLNYNVFLFICLCSFAGKKQIVVISIDGIRMTGELTLFCVRFLRITGKRKRINVILVQTYYCALNITLIHEIDIQRK
jgi:hypothetical protein